MFFIFARIAKFELEKKDGRKQSPKEANKTEPPKTKQRRIFRPRLRLPMAPLHRREEQIRLTEGRTHLRTALMTALRTLIGCFIQGWRAW